MNKNPDRSEIAAENIKYVGNKLKQELYNLLKVYG